jgi:hypothetical protein
MIKLKCKKYVLGLITCTNLKVMNLKLIRLFVFCGLVLFSISLFAQGPVKDEYRAEIGGAAGVNYYIGETNSLLFSNMRIAYGGFFRYRFDTRLALKAELSSATIAGAGMKDNSLYVGDICGEFNFFDLEQNPYKRYSKTFSPYIFAGICAMTDVYHGQKLPEFGLPFGVGLKVKLNTRLNLNVQWTNRLMFVDNLEGYSAPNETTDPFNNPYGLNGSNVFNNDLLSTLTVGLSWDIWKKQCDCMNNNSKR